MKLVVLGGSSGIGLATARLGVAAGWDVVVASRAPARADVAAEKVPLDVTDHAAVRTFFAGLGPVDHLVSSTVARAGGPARELDLDAARRSFEAKLWGPWAAIRGHHGFPPARDQDSTRAHGRRGARSARDRLGRRGARMTRYPAQPN